ncbi:hypothetical protein ACHAW6_000408, partial [Cyclotella cf. meneghiniana]
MQTTSSPTPSNPTTGLNSSKLTMMCMHTSACMNIAHSCTNLITMPVSSIPHQKSIEPTLLNKQSAPGKNHFVVMRAGAAKSYRLSNWCKDLEQTNITLNMMCPCTQNPNLLAQELLDGMFSFDATPMAPLGTKCMLHIKPACRHTWGYHSIQAQYFAPALNHYRCIKLVTDTSVVHLADTSTFLHSLPAPTISNTLIIKVIQHLNRTIMRKPPTQPDELEAITNLPNLISGTKSSVPSDATDNNA